LKSPVKDSMKVRRMPIVVGWVRKFFAAAFMPL